MTTNTNPVQQVSIEFNETSIKRFQSLQMTNIDKTGTHCSVAHCDIVHCSVAHCSSDISTDS